MSFPPVHHCPPSHSKLFGTNHGEIGNARLDKNLVGSLIYCDVSRKQQRHIGGI